MTDIVVRNARSYIPLTHSVVMRWMRSFVLDKKIISCLQIQTVVMNGSNNYNTITTIDLLNVMGVVLCCVVLCCVVFNLDLA